MVGVGAGSNGYAGVLMDDQDLSGGEKITTLNQEVSAKITKANVLCELYAAKLTSKCARENSLFWLTRDFFLLRRSNNKKAELCHSQREM